MSGLQREYPDPNRPGLVFTLEPGHIWLCPFEIIERQKEWDDNHMADINYLLKRMSEKLDCPCYRIEDFSDEINKSLLIYQAAKLPNKLIELFLGDDDGDGPQDQAIAKLWGITQLSDFLDGVFDGTILPLNGA